MWRISQHHLAKTNQDRHVFGGDVKLVEQVLDVGVTVEVQVCVRMAVARQKLLDVQRACTVIRSDEHNVAKPMRNQVDPPQNEGTHDDFAQLTIGLYQRQQALASQFDNLTRFAGAHAK
jgi:hypothetical protein